MKTINSILVIIIALSLTCNFEASGTVLRSESKPDRINFDPDHPAVPGEMIIKFRPFSGERTQTSPPSLNGIFAQLQVESMTKVFRNAKDHLGDIYRLRFGAPVLMFDAIRQVADDPNVEWVEPNYISSIFVTPNDPHFSIQWGLSKVQADLAWNISQGDPGVVIAVIDTGVDYDHLDLEDNIWHNPGEIPGNNIDDDMNGYVDDHIGWDFVSVPRNAIPPPDPNEDVSPPDNNPMDFHGHGTHCAGIASAVTDNNTGVAGTAWSCKIMALRAGYKTSDGSGSLPDSDSSEALYYAADEGADVISMSWGAIISSNVVSTAIQYALNKGCVLVAAAGNKGQDMKNYPAALPGVIAVAASDQNDKRAWFSNYGLWVDIAAPGKDIYSTIYGSGTHNDTYTNMDGTSMSTPFVAGAAALILSENPGLTANAVSSLLLDYADDINWGLDGPTKRLNTYRPLISASYSITINTPADGENIKGNSPYNITWQTTGDDIDHIHLMYSSDGGSIYQNIIAHTDNTGSYYWISVPAINSATFRVKAIAETPDNRALAEDITGNLKIDSNPPETAVTTGETPSDDGWFRSDVNVTLSAVDNLSGVEETKYKINNGSWQVYSSPYVITSSATVYFYSVDKAGNAETEKSMQINIDKIAPETNVSLAGTAGKDGWFKSVVNVGLLATDNLSGIKKIKYKIDNGNWQSYVSPFMLTDSAAVYYYSVDKAENTEPEKSIQIKIDKTIPETSVSLEGTTGKNGWFKSDVAVNLSAVDSPSGVEEIKYKVNGGTWLTYTSPFLVMGSTVYYYSVDKAGNIESEKSVQINIDSANPETGASLTGTSGKDGWFRSDVIVVLSATDNKSGVEGTKYKIDDGEWQTYIAQFVTTGSMVYYYSTDKAGNTELIKSTQVKIDKVAPQTEIALEGTEGENGWYISDVIVTLVATDALSGVDAIRYRINDSEWQTYSQPYEISGSIVKYNSEDKAGNLEPEQSREIKIDKTPPSVSVVSDDGSYTNSQIQLHASWSASSDDRSGIAEYRYAIGTAPSEDTMLNWQSAGLNTEVTAANLDLTGGQVYYFGVKARNGAGLWSGIGFSDGIVINVSPVVIDIPDVNFPEDGSYNSIDLDDYVDDPNNDDKEISWTYTGNTNVIINIDAATHVVTFTALPDWNGNENITFTATDPGNYSGSDSAKITVTPVNDPPVVRNLRIEPLPPGPGDDLNAIYVYEDIDGGIEEIIQIKWYKNGEQQPYDNFLSVPSTATFPGDEWYFTITPGDGIDVGETRTSPSVVIGGIVQELHLYPGWNFISVYIDILNSNISSVLSPIDGLYTIVWTYDAASKAWKRYIPGNLLSDLNTIEPGRGYLINITGNDEVILTIAGEQTQNTAIQLHSGENMVGYNSSVPELRENALSTIEYISIWTYDNLAKTWLKYIVNGPDLFNNLIRLLPGSGYWIYVEKDIIWTVPPE